MLCTCKEADLPAYCVDDLYCPRCGEPIFQLSSPNQPPQQDEPELWTYAQLSAQGAIYECQIGFSFQTRDRQRNPFPQKLSLELDKTELEMPSLFSRRLREVPEDEVIGGAGLSAYALELSKSVLANYGGEWQDAVPKDGLEGTLTLVGNCGRQSFKLKVFRDPLIKFVIVGDGVIYEGMTTDDDGVEKHSWSLGNLGPQNLKLLIAPTNCALAVSRSETEVRDQLFSEDHVFDGLDPIATGDRFDHDNPGQISFSFDASDWGEEQSHDLLFSPSWTGLSDRGYLWKLGFSRKSEGILRIGDGLERWRPLNEIYVGLTAGKVPEHDYEIPPLGFRNVGLRSMRLAPPILIKTSPANENDSTWIEIDQEKFNHQSHRWERIYRGLDLDLEPEEEGRYLLKLDFTGPSFAKPPISPRAEIEISIDDNRRVIHLPIDILPVDTPGLSFPPPLESILAIDFGNSNTYAAYVASNRTDDDGRPIQSVESVPLRQDDLEHNPTALYFRDETDVSVSRVLIGIDAITQGHANDVALFDDLKRVFVQPEKLNEEIRIGHRPILGRARLTRKDLVLIYLEKLLEVCQRKLKRQIHRVCFSHPANYGSRSRQAFEAIIKELEENWKKRHPLVDPDQIVFEDLAADEAGAVCLRFVLDDDAYRNEIEPRLAEAQEQRFYVASIDVGGGSTDLCLAEFFDRFPGQQIYQSWLRGIGGDETLGGDNFTVAVFEILRGRLSKLAEASQSTLRLAQLDQDRVIGDRLPWSNTRLLWNFAEEAKKLVFSSRWDSARAKKAADSFAAKAKVSPLAGAGSSSLWIDVKPLREAFEMAFAENSPWLTADEIYDFRIEKDQHGKGPYLLRRRLQLCLNHLGKYMERTRSNTESPPKTLFVLFAGAGSRVPLIADLVRDIMKEQQVNVIFPKEDDPPRPKEKVAVGLARYYDLMLSAPARFKGIDRSSRYTNADLVWDFSGQRMTPLVLVPTCSPLKNSQPIVVELKLPLEMLFRNFALKTIHIAREAFPRNVAIGHFSLSEPNSKNVVIDEIDLNASNPTLWIRVGEDEYDLYLSVYFADLDLKFGEWKLIAT